MAYPTNVQIGDRVRWESCEGTVRGEVKQIFDALDAYGDTIYFYYIEYLDGFGLPTMAMIAEDRLAEIEFKVTFRDYELQAEQAQYERMVEM